MGRNPRIHFPGAIYHAMARGVDGRDIFIDDGDRKKFLAAIRRVCEDSSAIILAYCLMGNHFHFAIKVGSIPLSSIMQRVTTGYALSFNWKYDRMGHLFQARYKASICLTDAYLAALIRYIHMNPVRAGLVLRPQDWPWSSLRSGQCPPDAEDLLEDFDPWPNDTAEELDLLREDETEPASLDELSAKISAQTGIAQESLKSRDCRRSVIAAKRLLAQAAVQSGHKLGVIAAWMRLDLSSISRYARAKKLQTARPDTNIL